MGKKPTRGGRGRTSKNRSPERPGAATLLSSFFEFLKRRATESIFVLLVAAAIGAFWWSWDYVKTWAKNAVIEATVAELNKDENRFIEPIKKTLAQLRSSEIGALSVGNFVLTASNPQYVLPLYMPPTKHVGKLSVLLSGDFVPSRSYVVLMLPNGRKIEINNTETTINLAELLRMGSASESGLPEGLFEKPQYIKGLRTLTFQLEGPDIEVNAQAGAPGDTKVERSILVRYLALVSPTIRLSNVE